MTFGSAALTRSGERDSTEVELALLARAATGDELAWLELRRALQRRGIELALGAVRWKPFAVRAWADVADRLRAMTPGDELRAIFPCVAAGNCDRVSFEDSIRRLAAEAHSLRERRLLERVVAREEHARSELFSDYAEPLLSVWCARRGPAYNEGEDLDRDFVHWFLSEYLMRPNDDFGYLAKFLAKARASRPPSFLAWWSAQAHDRFIDFRREKVETRSHARLERELEETLIDRAEASELAASPEARVVLEEAVRDLRGCLDAFAERKERPLARLILQLGRARPKTPWTRILGLFHALGVGFEGGSFSARQGRVSEAMLIAARQIGLCMERHGYDRLDVTFAVNALIDRMGHDLEQRPVPGGEA